MTHHCHWPGCETPVPPALWGCKRHWAYLPERFKRLIWKTYRPGQEIDKRPSEAYVAVAQDIQRWIGASASN